MEPRRRVVVVTGASRGLGLSIVQRLVKEAKYRVVASARAGSLRRFSEVGLSESSDLWFHPLDVTSGDERSALVENVVDRWGGIDFLINNAGIMFRAVVEHVTEQDRLTQMSVNYRAPMELTRLVLPGMRARRFGRIINISSVGGMMAMPTMSVYSASKFALEGASEALSYEVRPWNIYVTLIQPGFINSDGFEQVRLTERSQRSLESNHSPYHQHYKNMSGFTARIMRAVPSTPDSVAKKVLQIMEKRHPPIRSAGTFDALLFSAMRRLLPRGLYHEILYRSLPGIKTWGQERS